MGREYDPKKTLEAIEKWGRINAFGNLDTIYREKYDKKAEKRGTSADYEALKIIKKYIPKTQDGIQKLVDTLENSKVDSYLAGEVTSYAVNNSSEKKIKINLHKSGWWRNLGAYQEKGKELEINGDVDIIGRDMKGGKIIVNGDGSAFVGTGMEGGEIIVNGNLSDDPGWESKGGTIVVKENLTCQHYSSGATIIEENSSGKNKENVVIYCGEPGKKFPRIRIVNEDISSNKKVISYLGEQKEKFPEKEVIPKESYNRDLLVGKIEVARDKNEIVSAIDNMKEEAEKVREELETKFPQGENKEDYKSKVTRIFRGKKK